MSRGTSWAQDFLMGARFSVAGGREGWIRTLLTALGVGLGVALLLFTTALPGALDARDQRSAMRDSYVTAEKPGDGTLLIGHADSTFKDKSVWGRLVGAPGSKPPLPPGLDRIPATGEMMVSPALAELLSSPEGRLLQPRLPYEQAGTVGPEGLLGPHDLVYYAGSDTMKAGDDYVELVKGFGDPQQEEPWDPVLLLLILIVLIVLLLPVAVFIAAAVRFGGERRDRRLAALRLVGADGATTRRIAAGEALGGALLGLLAGLCFFFAGRQLADEVGVFETGIYPSDVALNPALALLVAVAVPVASVAVTLLAMRGVVVEPLGVVRTARPPRRRLWWRLVMPLAGLALLYPMIGQDEDEQFSQWQVTGGVVLLLVGVTALLPWLVEFAVTRLGGGSVAWQLAVRRLQLSSGIVVRPVNGIAVAVAGAIALQSLFTGVESDYRRDTGADPDRAQIQVSVPSQIDGSRMPAITEKVASAEGARRALAFGSTDVGGKAHNPEHYIGLIVAECATLREFAGLKTCEEGDAFLLRPNEEQPEFAEPTAKPGEKVFINPSSDDGRESTPTAWTVPADAPYVDSRPDPSGYRRGGIMATPSALPEIPAGTLYHSMFVTLDPAVPDAHEHVRNALAQGDPLLQPMSIAAVDVNNRFAAVSKGLLIGSVAVLLLIGASLFVSQMEQLRERRKLLAALVAFGTRRRTLGVSVLWQTAVPIALGLTLACATGLALGAILLRMVSRPVHFDWGAVGTMTGAGAAVVLLVTVLSLPPLWRMMRPEGLRTE
ncbi:ABC transporter permease [Streptomyces sp. GC420]|uniref:ABC transporter permease n=1 Tax=Streptomyces sp. GC420 TaxID=2697568 RepID=UPI001414D2ED|nr:FtsX-like permease family protein [Streptomyces sp. GC420]NBM16582.1 ABC transporter permease [Streptomyces sp. GC420]